MPSYVDKLRVNLEVAEPGREPMRGMVSLAPRTSLHAGPETVLDLLNSKQRVIPVTRPDGGTVIFTRLQIAWVRVAADLEPQLVWPESYRVSREESVLVEMEDGSRLAGRIQMELPADLNRTSDFLNGPGDFYPLVARAGIYLVNKAKMRAAALFEVSPLPIEVL